MNARGFHVHTMLGREILLTYGCFEPVFWLIPIVDILDETILRILLDAGRLPIKTLGNTLRCKMRPALIIH